MRDKRTIHIANYEIQKLTNQLEQQKDEAKAELMKSTRALETLRLETTKNEQMAEQAKEALRSCKTDMKRDWYLQQICSVRKRNWRRLSWP